LAGIRGIGGCFGEPHVAHLCERPSLYDAWMKQYSSLRPWLFALSFYPILFFQDDAVPPILREERGRLIDNERI
jgi:hypothetical protein